MVGIVIVSHSQKLAESVVELAKMMAPLANIISAGGMEDGTLGTSYDKIKNAIESVYSEDGVLVLCDMGSSIMTTSMVLEELNKDNIKICDCPLVEGAIKLAVDSINSNNIDEIEPTWDNSILNKN